jgi:hypothetical protein
MDIPSLFMIPSAVSSGKVHSVFPNSTDADFDFNRDSDATRVNSEGLIERVGYYGSELASQPINLTNDFIANSGGVIVDADTFTTSGSSLDGIKSNTSVFSLTVGKTYKIDIQGNTTSSGFTLGNISASGNEYGSGFGVHTFVSQNTQLWIRQNTEGTTNITSLSVVEVTGDRARLNYEIEGGLVNTKPSLLLEPQSTNLVTYSEDFSGYVNANIRIESNQIIAPDGVSKSSKLSKSAFFENIQSQATISNSTNYTFSVFVKQGTLNRITLRLASGSNDVRKCLDLSDLSVSDAAGNQTGFVSSKVERLVNDWYRFSVTATSNGTTQFINIYAGKGNVVESGNIYIWGAMLEQQSYPTSYIPTNGSAQTRAAETCRGAGTSSIFNDSEGILFAELKNIANDGTNKCISISAGLSTNERVTIVLGTGDNIIRPMVKAGGVSVFDATTSSYNTINNFVKIAVRYKANNFACWVNGTQVLTDTSGAIPTGLDTLKFDIGNNTLHFYGKVKDIRVYNTKEMTDSEVDILLTKITS